MNCVWIVYPYAEIPKAGLRDDRYFLIAKFLSAAGYNVQLFIPSFSHKEKKIVTTEKQHQLQPNLNIVYVDTAGYTDHVSLKRVKHEKAFATFIAANSLDLPQPSFIILREPAIFMYGSLKPFIEKTGAKLIVDIIDLWPEIFELKLPRAFRWSGKLVFSPFYATRRKIYQAASAVTAVSPDYLTQVLQYNNKVPGKVIYWGCNVAQIEHALQSAKPNLLTQLKLPEKGTNIWGIYAGTLGEGYDMSTLIEAARQMATVAPQLKFLIAGLGPKAEMVKQAAQENDNIYYLGSLPANILYQLFSFCDFGFSTYADGSAVSMPIKCYDYFAAGLPLVNSLGRNLGKIVQTQKVGYQYKASNVASLKKALTLLLSSDLQEMKQRCKALGYEFNEQVQYPKFVEVLQELEA